MAAGRRTKPPGEWPRITVEMAAFGEQKVVGLVGKVEWRLVERKPPAGVMGSQLAAEWDDFRTKGKLKSGASREEAMWVYGSGDKRG